MNFYRPVAVNLLPRLGALSRVVAVVVALGVVVVVSQDWGAWVKDWVTQATR